MEPSSFDWLGKLLDGAVPLDEELQLDPTMLPDDCKPSEMGGHPDWCACCSPELDAMQLAEESLPALEALLAEPGADAWLPELPDSLAAPLDASDPLDAVLARLQDPEAALAVPAEAAGDTGLVQPATSQPSAPPPLPLLLPEGKAGVDAASNSQTASKPEAKFASPTVTGASTQTSAGAPSAVTRQKRPHDDTAQPAHSGESAHSAMHAAGRSQGLREGSPACESAAPGVHRQASSQQHRLSPASSDSDCGAQTSRPAAGIAHSPASNTDAPATSNSSGEHRSNNSAQTDFRRGAAVPEVEFQPPWPAAAPLPGLQAALASAGQAGSSGKALQDPADSEEARRYARMQRNRESAHMSRQRKKMHTDEVERRCQELQSHNTQLAGMVSRLTADNACLRHQLLTVCAQTGQTPSGPVPPPLFPPSLMPPVPGIPCAGGTPKVPIQRLKPVRPAPAPTLQRKQQNAPPAEAPAQALPPSAADKGSQPARKKTKAAAGTALLAMFACVMFCGPFSPSSTPLFSHQPVGQVQPYTRMPAGRPMLGGGRVLTALPPAQPNSTHAAAVAVVKGMLNDLSELGDGGGGGYGGSINGSGALLSQNDPVLESLALQRLKELAPLALFANGPEQQLPGGLSFGNIAQSVFGAEGLAAPVGCREVFRFDAAGLLNHDFPAAQVEQYVQSLTAPKQRRRPQAALPLLPAGTPRHEVDTAASAGNIGGGSIGRSRQPRGPTIVGDTQESNDAPALVSMLLPTKKTSAQRGGNLTALDQIFVIMSEPASTYATYSCRLPSPVLV